MISKLILIIMVKWIQIWDTISQSFPHLHISLILNLINLSISLTLHSLFPHSFFLARTCWVGADRSECVVVRRCPLLSSRVLAQLSAPAHFETEVNSRCNCFDCTALQSSSTDKSIDFGAIFWCCYLGSVLVGTVQLFFWKSLHKRNSKYNQ